MPASAKSHSWKSISQAVEEEYLCPLCCESYIRRPGEPVPVCEECGAETLFYDGPDERAKKAAVMLDGGWEEDF